MKIFRPHVTASRLLSVAATGLLLAVTACGAGAQEPAIPASAGIHSWYENGTGGHYVAPLISGSTQALVPGSRVGTVMTDTNCTPDARGLSHCHNSIAFDDGSRITVQDNHQMSRHRCLRPGERVRVTRLRDGWVSLQTGI